MATPAPERRSNLRRREPAPHEAFAGGEYRWGTFDGPIANVNLLDRWSGPARRFHGSRLKEWQAFQLVNDRYFVLGAVHAVLYWVSVSFLTPLVLNFAVAFMYAVTHDLPLHFFGLQVLG